MCIAANRFLPTTHRCVAHNTPIHKQKTNFIYCTFSQCIFSCILLDVCSLIYNFFFVGSHFHLRVIAWRNGVESILLFVLSANFHKYIHMFVAAEIGGGGVCEMLRVGQTHIHKGGLMAIYMTFAYTFQPCMSDRYVWCMLMLLMLYRNIRRPQERRYMCCVLRQRIFRVTNTRASRMIRKKK